MSGITASRVMLAVAGISEDAVEDTDAAVSPAFAVEKQDSLFSPKVSTEDNDSDNDGVCQLFI